MAAIIIIMFSNRKLPNLAIRLGNFRIAIRQFSVFTLYIIGIAMPLQRGTASISVLLTASCSTSTVRQDCFTPSSTPNSLPFSCLPSHASARRVSSTRRLPGRESFLALLWPPQKQSLKHGASGSVSEYQ